MKIILIRTEILMWDLGFIAKHNNKLPKDCTVDKPLEAITRKLTLVDLSPAFVILGVGISLSAFCFVVEKLSKYIGSLSLVNGSKDISGRLAHLTLYITNIWADEK